MKCLILTVVLVSAVAVTSVPMVAKKQVCEPRKTFNDSCNTCVCSEDGLSADCTKIWCDENVWNQDATTNITVRSADARVVGECPACTCTCTCSKL